MGKYFDKASAGSGFTILLVDTLFKKNDSEFKGKFYTIFKTDKKYILLPGKNKNKKIEIENEHDTAKVNADLNNAYYLKSYLNLSHKINNKFPLYHYSFRNGYSAWNKLTNKTGNRQQFIENTDMEIKNVYDSIFEKQTILTNTTNFITENAKQTDYLILKDSLKTLPVDYRPKCGYFDESVYQMVKSNPENFYKLLQDFPANKEFIYFAVDKDKELMEQLKQVTGYGVLKKEFVKERKSTKTMIYKVFGIYAICGGLLTWLIISQP
jgi:hypothetical protein